MVGIGIGLGIGCARSVVHPIYGVSWEAGTTNPALSRTGAAVGKVAAAGVGAGTVTNDFDTLAPWSEMTSVTDDLGNVFIRIPKVYVRKTATSIEISKTPHAGFYLPWVFWDFTNGRELPYYLHGKHLASLGAGNVLESKAAVYPLMNKNIVDFRGYAQANNAGGRLGYQQLDVHAQDLITSLFTVEFATLDCQSILQGYVSGQYSATHVATVAEAGANRIIVASAHADLFRVGQSVSIGTSLGGNQVAYNRTITSIDVYDGSNKAISFDGAAVGIALGNIVYNSGYKTGFSSQVAASSGCVVANDGKHPCTYRGIESPWGDMWQFVDGVNINEMQAWVCANAASYQSNLFFAPYEQLSYVNHNANGYPTELGLDPAHPEAQIPTAINAASASSRYRDYYYQASGQRVALVGGSWSNGSYAGLRFWNLYYASSVAFLNVGARLLKKALS